MATKATASRGTKRTCQNQECGSRFYDLERDPIVCPICDSAYVIAHAQMSAVDAAAIAAAEDKAARKAKKDQLDADNAASAIPGAEGDEALADLDGADEPIAAEEDETFLEEEEEEGGDMSNIIGGPVEGGGEET
jgi:uncharacterized protein (TIGR02300 family)